MRMTRGMWAVAALGAVLVFGAASFRVAAAPAGSAVEPRPGTGERGQAGPSAGAQPGSKGPGTLRVVCEGSGAGSAERSSGWSWAKVGRDILLTVVYSLLGLVIALFGYQVYHWITPFDLRKELEVDQNTALGIVAGAIILGLCIIVAAAILSP